MADQGSVSRRSQDIRHITVLGVGDHDMARRADFGDFWYQSGLNSPCHLQRYSNSIF
jgi:hypothetical protein